MKKSTLYGLKNCDSCKKAMKDLTNLGYEVDFKDVRKDGISKELLSEFFAKFGNDLVNTRSTTWRGLDAEMRAKPALDLLFEHPTLMKRPVIISAGNEMTLGWKSDAQEKYN